MRHGEVHNPDGILYGRAPGYRLSDRGQQMVARVAEVLHAGGHDLRAVVASPLQRAQESALPTARAYGLDVAADARLVEAANIFEGVAVNRNRAILAHPRYWHAYVNRCGPAGASPTGSRWPA
jgi:broad specificity phosphatase PhoE